MADLWYYAHNEDRIGPCSGRELKELAASGQILPTDTIWQEGREQGISATRLKNLFPPAPADVRPVSVGIPAAAASPSPPSTDTPSSGAHSPAAPPKDTNLKPPEKATVALNPPASAQKPARKGRVVAVKGAIITYPDGINLKYRKKCTACGYEDNCRSSMPIRNGMTTTSFHCPKCRKTRVVEIQGTTH